MKDSKEVNKVGFGRRKGKREIIYSIISRNKRNIFKETLKRSFF